MDSTQAPQPEGSHGASHTQSVDVMRLLMGSRRIMLISIATCLVLALLFMLIATPRFEADALVQVEPTPPSLGSSVNQVQDVFDTTAKAADEKEIISSRAVLEPVVNELNLRDTAEPDYFPILGRGSRALAALPYFRNYGWAGDRLTLGKFSVPASIEDVPLVLTVTDDGGYRIEADGVAIGDGKVGTAFSMPFNEGVISILVKKIEADAGTRFNLVKKRTFLAIDALMAQLNVAELSRGSNLLSITVQDASASLAAEKANLIADFYVRQNVERHSAEAQKTLEFLKQEVPEIRERLHAAEEELRKFRVERKSVDITLEASQLLEQESSISLQRLNLTQKRTELRQRFTDRHPEVIALNQQIAELDGQLARIHGAADSLPETQQKLLRLTLDVKVQDEFYTSLQNNIQQLEVAKAGKIGNVRIIDHAMTPPHSYFPQPLLIYPAGLVAGIIFGILIAIGVMLFDRNEYDPIEVERLLGVPVIAQIPLSRQKKILRGTGKQRLLAEAASGDQAVEALRSLRTTLHFDSVGASGNVILVTGPKQAVGKTFVTANLGYLLAISGKKVLLIDGDLRRGRLHSYFGFDRGPGLSEALAGSPPESVTRAFGVGNLLCITSGKLPPNPSELLLSERFPQLLAQISPGYDFVLIDSPPVLAVGDAGIIGRLAGTTLVVARSGHHTARELRQMMKMLAQAGARSRGAIINQVVKSGASYDYYHHTEYRSDFGKRS